MKERNGCANDKESLDSQTWLGSRQCHRRCPDRVRSAVLHRANAWFVHELGKFPHDEQATACLIDQLCRDQPGARYYAAESLKQHLLYCNDALRVRALLQLTKVLDDSRFALVSFPIYGPLLPGGSHFTETSVRIRALATLASSTQKDFGFDQERWRTYIESRAATLSKDK